MQSIPHKKGLGVLAKINKRRSHHHPIDEFRKLCHLMGIFNAKT